jgi:hypothetical protein
LDHLRSPIISQEERPFPDSLFYHGYSPRVYRGFPEILLRLSDFGDDSRLTECQGIDNVLQVLTLPLTNYRMGKSSPKDLGPEFLWDRIRPCESMIFL